MRTLVLALLLFAAPSLWANTSGTFSADGESSVVNFRVGLGSVLLSGTWGSGTASVQVRRLDGSFEEVKAYTSTDAADTTPVVFDFATPVDVKIVFSGSTSPSLYYEIREGAVR